jgi:Histone methylation protein DOT1
MAHALAAQLGGEVLAHYGPAVQLFAARWHSGFIGLSVAVDHFTLRQLAQKLRYLLFRISEVFYEWRFGIVSDMEILNDQLGITDMSCHDYLATGYLRFRQLMKHIEIRDGKDVFLDFGSGLGRAVILAATYPFRKIIGVELVTDLHLRAGENVRRALRRLCCRDIELYNVDARTFRIPDDVTVIYMWNPFAGEVLRQVCANIQQSVLESPRALTILHLSPYDPTDLDLIKENLPWLRERKRFKLGSASHAVIYTCGEPEEPTATSEAVPELAEAL